MDDTDVVQRSRAARRLGAGAGRRLLLLILILMAVAACASDGSDVRSRSLTGAVRSPPLQVASISLPDVGNGGKSVTMQAPQDELYLVYFGYTSCPDVCPTTMSDISVALGDLPEALAARVTVAMATVDPERDTDQILTGYLAHFFAHSIALRTTDAADLETATTAFGVTWEAEVHSPGDAYNVAHTAVTYVVDDTGTVVVEWPFGLDTKGMTSDLINLLDEEPT